MFRMVVIQEGICIYRWAEKVYKQVGGGALILLFELCCVE